MSSRFIYLYIYIVRHINNLFRPFRAIRLVIASDILRGSLTIIYCNLVNVILV